MSDISVDWVNKRRKMLLTDVSLFWNFQGLGRHCKKNPFSLKLDNERLKLDEVLLCCSVQSHSEVFVNVN